MTTHRGIINIKATGSRQHIAQFNYELSKQYAQFFLENQPFGSTRYVPNTKRAFLNKSFYTTMPSASLLLNDTDSNYDIRPFESFEYLVIDIRATLYETPRKVGHIYPPIHYGQETYDRFEKGQHTVQEAESVQLYLPKTKALKDTSVQDFNHRVGVLLTQHEYNNHIVVKRGGLPKCLVDNGLTKKSSF